MHRKLTECRADARKVIVSQCFVQMRYHSSTFHLSGDVSSTSVNFPCIRGTIHQSFVCQRNIVSSSVNILGGRVTFRLLPSTSCASVRPSFLLAFHVAAGLLSTFLASVGCSISLGQLSVHQRGLPSTSINFLSTRCSFCQVLSTPCESAGPCVHFSYAHGIFCQTFVCPRVLP